MEYFWHENKEKLLESQPGRPTFKMVVEAISSGGLLEERENPNYPGQAVLLVKISGQKHMAVVPATKLKEGYFFHTAYFSRKTSKEKKND